MLPKMQILFYLKCEGFYISYTYRMYLSQLDLVLIKISNLLLKVLWIFVVQILPKPSTFWQKCGEEISSFYSFLQNCSMLFLWVGSKMLHLNLECCFYIYRRISQNKRHEYTIIILQRLYILLLRRKKKVVFFFRNYCSKKVSAHIQKRNTPCSSISIFVLIS